MGFLTPNNIKDFRSLYTLQVRYLLSTENQIVKGLQSMIENTTDDQLKQAFQTHLQETQGHVSRLEQIIAEINDGDVDDKKDPIITALIGSGENIVSESDKGLLRDAGLLQGYVGSVRRCEELQRPGNPRWLLLRSAPCKRAPPRRRDHDCCWRTLNRSGFHEAARCGVRATLRQYSLQGARSC